MKEHFYGWRIVLASVIALAITGPASVAVANIFQTPVVHEFGIEPSQFAINNFIVLGVGILLSPKVTNLYFKGNINRKYTLGTLIYALCFAAYGLAPNIYIFYLLSFGVGLGFVMTNMAPIGILVNAWFVEKKGLAMSLAASGLGIGGIIFSQLLTYLIGQFGWRHTYLIYAAIMIIIVCPVMYFVIKDKPEDIGQVALGSQEANAQAGTASEEEAYTVKLHVKEALSKPFFLMLIIGAVCVGIVNNGGLGQFPPAITLLHNAQKAANITAIYSGVGIIGKLLLGNINDRFGIQASIKYSMALCMLTYFLATQSGNYPFAILMAICFGLGNAIGTVMGPLITSAIFSGRDYSQAYGYLQSGLNTGMALGSVLAATVADLAGTYDAAWYVLLFISLAMGIFWLGAYRQSRQYI